MKPALLALSIILLGNTAYGKELYRGNPCWSLMNEDTIISPEMITKINATDTKDFLSSIGRMTMTSAVAVHRGQQCQLKKAGQPFEAECPVGLTIHIDDHVQTAIQNHASKSEAALVEQLANVTNNARAKINSMTDSCK